MHFNCRGVFWPPVSSVQVEPPLVEWGPDQFLWVVRDGSIVGKVFRLAKVLPSLKRTCPGKWCGFFEIEVQAFTAKAGVDQDWKWRQKTVFPSLDPIRPRCLHDSHAEVHAGGQSPPVQHHLLPHHLRLLNRCHQEPLQYSWQTGQKTRGGSIRLPPAGFHGTLGEQIWLSCCLSCEEHDEQYGLEFNLMGFVLSHIFLVPKTFMFGCTINWTNPTTLNLEIW